MKLFISACIFFLTWLTQAQNEKSISQQELYTTIIAIDKAVFDAYNNCDIELFKTFFSDDTEFYHDKGGVTLTNTKLAESVRNNLCSKQGFRLRREAIPNTLQVYPMDNYGALLTGEHLFYESINGKEKLTGKAKFTHLFRLINGVWKITRMLSYDHQPAQ